MSNYEALMQRARQALTDGHRHEARRLLHQALQQREDDPRAWLWLAGVAASPRASLNYIEQADRLKPGDGTIARARAWAEERLAEEAAAAASVVTSGGYGDAPTATGGAPAAVDAAAKRPTALRYLRPLALSGALFLLLLLGALLLRQELGNRLWSEVAAGAEMVAPETADRPSSVERTDERQSATSPLASEEEQQTAAPGGVDLARGRFLPRNPVVIADEAAPTSVPPATRPALQAKAVAAGEADDAPRPTWTPTATATPTPTPTPTPVATFVSADRVTRAAQRPPGVGPNERWIDVNLTTQRLVAYEGDTPVFESAVSSGTAAHPTVTGQFEVWLRYEAQTMDGRRLGYDYYLPNVPYVMYFYRDYALHGTYWHNNFGTPMSHGCVNLPTPAAEWLFHWSEYGTVVNVHY